MISEKLIKFVEEELDKGTDPAKIKKTLSAAGWEETEIEEALKQFMGSQDPLEGHEKITPKEEKKEKVDKEEVKSFKLLLKGKEEKTRLFLFVVTLLMMAALCAGVIIALLFFDPSMFM